MSATAEAPLAAAASRPANAGMLAIFQPEASDDESTRVAQELTGRGWRVWVAPLPATPNDVDCAGYIADFLAGPQCPDRIALLGYGAAGAAVLEFADEHPERALAVVVVDSADTVRLAVEASNRSLAELSCPSAVLADADHQAVVAAVLDVVDRAQATLPRATQTVAAGPRPVGALTPALLNDPDAMGRLREQAPIHRVNASGVAASWILTGYAATTTTLADPALIGQVEITAGFRLQSADSGIVHRGEQDLITIDDQEHARLRRLVGHYLTPLRVDALRPRIAREADALLDALPTHEPIDLIPAFARPFPIAVLCELLGIPCEDRDYIYEWLVERMTVVPPQAHSDVDDYLRGLISARRTNPSDDLLGWVVEAEGANLNEEDVIAAARLLMVAGHRAPLTLLANGIAALLGHPDQWQRLVADPAQLAPAVEELLRYVTPFPVGLARIPTKPITVGEVQVPAGDLIAASLVAANRDPSVFVNPDQLDIGRERNQHLAFGYGHHYCLGAALARVETEVALGAFVRRFPQMRLAGDARDLHYRHSRVRYLLTLPVVLAPHS